MSFDSKEAEVVLTWYLHSIMWSFPLVGALQLLEYFGVISRTGSVHGALMIGVFIVMALLAVWTSGFRGDRNWWPAPEPEPDPKPAPPEEEIPEWVIEGDAMTCISKAAGAFDDRL